MGHKYTCAACGKEFIGAWSDEEAMAESKELWGEFEPDDLAVICDDCFKRGKDDALEEFKRTGDRSDGSESDPSSLKPNTSKEG